MALCKASFTLGLLLVLEAFLCGFATSTIQRTAIGTIEIVDANTERIIIKNNHGAVSEDVNLDGWKIKCEVDNQPPQEIEYTFQNIVLRPAKSVKIYGFNFAVQAGFDDLINSEAGSWGSGTRVVIELTNDEGEEMATLIKTTTVGA